MGHKQKTFAFLLAAIALLTSLAHAQDQDTANDEPDKASADPPRPEVEEYVYVEGSLPYVPNSNTVMNRLLSSCS